MSQEKGQERGAEQERREENGVRTVGKAKEGEVCPDAGVAIIEQVGLHQCIFAVLEPFCPKAARPQLEEQRGAVVNSTACCRN